MMKLNLGSHKKIKEGFTNVDVQDLEGVDVVYNLTQFPYPFEPESIDEIYNSEFLEHISFRQIKNVLIECYRILKWDGSMRISCPDIEAMCRMIDKQCKCVPQKAEKMEEYKADPHCEICGGKALIHPMRWRLAFIGAQKNEWDYHRNVITWDYLWELLDEIGFRDIIKKPNIYKLVVNCKK